MIAVRKSNQLMTRLLAGKIASQVSYPVDARKNQLDPKLHLHTMRPIFRTTLVTNLADWS